MNKVVHREENFWGRTSVIILAGGFAFVMVSVTNNDKDVAVVHDLMVHESRRKKGLGEKLLKEATIEAENLGAGVVRIAVEPGTWQVEWYKRNGYQEDGLVDFESHDCLVLEKEIIRREMVEPQSRL